LPAIGNKNTGTSGPQNGTNQGYMTQQKKPNGLQQQQAYAVYHVGGSKLNSSHFPTIFQLSEEKVHWV